MKKPEMLTLLSNKVSECEKCPKLVEERTKTVPGEGNPNAKLLILGEAPGQKEDEQGRPFVGKAGELLDNILLACGLNRDSVYITNTIKCRPPGNRNPLPVESNNCRSFLDLQLKVIKPEFIICLGSVAAQNLLGIKAGINALRRQWHYIEQPIQAKILCIYHPAYLLRNPYAKKDVWEDLQLLLKEL